MIKLTLYLAAVLLLLLVGFTVPFQAIVTDWPMMAFGLLTSAGVYACGYAAGRISAARLALAKETAVSERRRARIAAAQQQAASQQQATRPLVGTYQQPAQQRGRRGGGAW